MNRLKTFTTTFFFPILCIIISFNSLTVYAQTISFGPKQNLLDFDDNIGKVVFQDENLDDKLEILVDQPGRIFYDAGSLDYSIIDTFSTGFFNNIPVGFFDMNNDDELDLVGTETWFSRDSTGAWQENIIRIGENFVFRGRILGVTDLDKDMDMDLIAISTNGQSLQLTYNDSIGIQFSDYEIVFTAEDNIEAVDVNDFNGDGKVDFLTTFFFRNFLYLHTSQDTGGYAQTIISIPDRTDEFKAIFADVDNDADLDILFGDVEFSAYWIPSDEGNLGESQQLLNSSSIIEPEQGLVVDIDHDEINDIILLGYRSFFSPTVKREYVVGYLKGLGNGQFDSFVDIGIYPDFDGTIDFVPFFIEDLDQDSLMDVIVLEEDKLVWYKNESTPPTDSMTTSISKVPQSRKFQVYPNPTSNLLNLESQNFQGNNSDLDIIISDVLGRVIANYSLKENHNGIQISLQEFENGIYNLLIFDKQSKLPIESFQIKKQN